MFEKHFGNPLNRRKKKYKFILRIIEDFIKKFLIFFIILPISSPLLIINNFNKKKYYFKEFSNHNGIVFLIFILKELKNPKFLINLNDFDLVFSRFGFFFTIKNFSIKLFFNKSYSISLKDKKAHYYLNQDYFQYFDNQIKENDNNFLLPFYLPKNYYLDGSINKYKKLRFKKKKFKIIFSGSTHDEWYGDLDFSNTSNKKFLNRQEILAIIKKNFYEKCLIISNISELDKIRNTNKEILIIETNPALSLRKKNFSQDIHLNLIAESKFFICAPGTSMPICYHLIESCLVGTVPILSYNDYLYPQFSNKEAIFFFDEKELITSIKHALQIKNPNYILMKKNSINYFEKNLSTNSIINKIIKKKNPLEIYVNLDHVSSFLKKKRDLK